MSGVAHARTAGMGIRLLVLIAIVGSALCDDVPCLKEMERCHQTEYRAYVRCIVGREKRSLCIDDTTFPIDCSDGSCTIIDPIMINANSPQSCIGTECAIGQLPSFVEAVPTPPKPTPIPPRVPAKAPTSLPISTNCIQCPPNNCSEGRCTNACDDTCCVTQCLEGCRSDICYGKCLSLCGKDDVIVATSSSTTTQSNVDFPTTTPTLPHHTTTPETTTIKNKNLYETINDNIPDEPIKNESIDGPKPNEVEKKPDKSDPVEESSPEVAPSPKARCCVVVQTKCRHGQQTSDRCTRKRHRSCGDHCTADVVYSRVRRKCNGDKCTQEIEYAPEPKAKCVYQETWPYVSCGVQKRSPCSGCYENSKKDHGKSKPECAGCFDDEHTRPLPANAPQNYYQPPCQLSNSCQYKAPPMGGYFMMMPVFVPMPLQQPTYGGGCLGHEPMSQSFPDDADQRRQIVMVKDTEEHGDDDNPWDENAILPNKYEPPDNQMPFNPFMPYGPPNPYPYYSNPYWTGNNNQNYYNYNSNQYSASDDKKSYKK